MRRYELTRKYHAAFTSLGPVERASASAVIAELMDDHVPLVGPDDFSVAHGLAIMGRWVPGTDLVLPAPASR